MKIRLNDSRRDAEARSLLALEQFKNASTDKSKKTKQANKHAAFSFSESKTNLKASHQSKNLSYLPPGELDFPHSRRTGSISNLIRSDSPNHMATSIMEDLGVEFPHKRVVFTNREDEDIMKINKIRWRADAVYSEFYETEGYDALMNKRFQECQQEYDEGGGEGEEIDNQKRRGSEEKEGEERNGNQAQTEGEDKEMDPYLLFSKVKKQKLEDLESAKQKYKKGTNRDGNDLSWDVMKYAKDSILFRPIKKIAGERNPTLKLREEPRPNKNMKKVDFLGSPRKVKNGNRKSFLIISQGREKQRDLGSPFPSVKTPNESGKKIQIPKKNTTLGNELTPIISSSSNIHNQHILSEASLIAYEKSFLKLKPTYNSENMIVGGIRTEANTNEKNKVSIEIHKQKIDSFQNFLNLKLKKIGIPDQESLLKMVKSHFGDFPARALDEQPDHEILKSRRKPKVDLIQRINNAKVSQIFKHIRCSDAHKPAPQIKISSSSSKQKLGKTDFKKNGEKEKFVVIKKSGKEDRSIGSQSHNRMNGVFVIKSSIMQNRKSSVSKRNGLKPRIKINSSLGAFPQNDEKVADRPPSHKVERKTHK